MCGIMCQISKSESLKERDILQRIKNRGPDSYDSIQVISENGKHLLFCGSVLWMQGPIPTPQPIENEKGILLFNGDIFDKSWDGNKCDTLTILEKLSDAVDRNGDHNIISVLKSLKGPFSIIYFDKLHHHLYFARDRIGRNSLLLHKDNDFITISSVLDRKHVCVEIPATCINKLLISENTIELHPWSAKIKTTEVYNFDEWLTILRNQQSVADSDFIFECDETLDFQEKDDIVEYILKISQSTDCKKTLFSNLMKNSTIMNTVLRICDLLENSIELRLKTQPNRCKKCLHAIEECSSHCCVGVLFSGGLDCTILALLADKYLPENQTIDLINVAFSKDNNSTYSVPDRLTGIESFQELQLLCPSRDWNFKQVNIPQEELLMYQASVIGDLIYPRKTILDESLGCALWFAARGSDNTSESPCRVLLLGSGADELFGGYTRHRNAYKRHGWIGLSKELQLDWNRISFRNLARDNRVICDHGRQPRMPYLDEDLTDYVLQLKPWFKCFPSQELGPGVGDKLILRLVAFHLGLTNVSSAPKRALQFGSRIANKKEKGSDISKTFIQ